MTQPASYLDLHSKVDHLVEQIGMLIKGKKAQIQDAVACMLSNGHVLIEDVPGVGKTTLAQALARCLGLAFSRVQFTSDLMPSDLLGVSIYERQSESFVFHPGPVFTQVLLADEINRAGPKTQSALLEAMEENQVSSDGETRPLPQPFFVIATQNPTDQLGTFQLPESQLDRFLMCITLGYPDAASERAMLTGQDSREALAQLPVVLGAMQLQAAQRAIQSVHIAEPLLQYLQDLIAATRSGQWFAQGLSPRAALAVLRLAKARAWMQRRSFVAPEDVQAILPQAAAHRMVALPQASRGKLEQVRAMIEAVPLP